MMQQKLPRLKVQGLVIANEMPKKLLSLKPWPTYRKPIQTKAVILSTFTDAAHPRDRDYGQTGLITGLRVIDKDGLSEIFHPIDWTSHKRKRVSYSSYGAEMLAAADGDDRGYYYRMTINSLFPNRCTKQELNVDSRVLYDTTTMLHESTEYRLRNSVRRMRNSFESRE